MISCFTELYERRRKIDCANQSKFFDIFNDIDADLQEYYNQDICHPYEISPNSNFTSNTYYYEGSKDWFIISPQTKNGFLYRIDNISQLLLRSPIGNKNICNKDILRKKYDIGLDGFICDLVDRASITDLFKKMQEKSTWIPLSDLLLEYKPIRNITWWTDQDLSLNISPEAIMIEALRLGIPSDKLIKSTILMRLNLAYINANTTFSVPSVIDAFNSPIFASQNQDHNPNFGTPIDLINFSISKYKDFVVRNIPLDALEIFPIAIPILIKEKYYKKGESDALYKEIIKLYDNNIKTDEFNS